MFVSQHHEVLDAFLRSGDDLELQIHLMGGLRGRGAPACRGMRVSVVSEIIQDVVPVGVRAILRVWPRRFVHEQRPDLPFVGGIDPRQGELAYRRPRPLLDDKGYIPAAGNVPEFVIDLWRNSGVKKSPRLVKGQQRRDFLVHEGLAVGG